MLLRRLTPADIPEILRVQSEAYRADLCEAEDAFINKMKILPEGSVGLFEGDVLGGYLIAVAWQGDAIVEPHRMLSGLPAAEDTLFIHDVAVSTAARGRGVGKSLAERAIAIARSRRLRRLALVAVQSADAFWARFGFRPVESIVYGPGVPGTRMVLELPL